MHDVQNDVAFNDGINDVMNNLGFLNYVIFVNTGTNNFVYTIQHCGGTN